MALLLAAFDKTLPEKDQHTSKQFIYGTPVLSIKSPLTETFRNYMSHTNTPVLHSAAKTSNTQPG